MHKRAKDERESKLSPRYDRAAYDVLMGTELKLGKWKGYDLRIVYWAAESFSLTGANKYSPLDNGYLVMSSMGSISATLDSSGFGASEEIIRSGKQLEHSDKQEAAYLSAEGKGTSATCRGSSDQGFLPFSRPAYSPRKLIIGRH